MVTAAVRTIFVQTDRKAALLQLNQVADSLRGQFPKVADTLLDNAYDVLAYMSFPAVHWRQIASTNPLERLNREIGRRADVISIFPNRAAVLRLIGAVLMEQCDEWAAASRHYFSPWPNPAPLRLLSSRLPSPHGPLRVRLPENSKPS
jgi:transposase-like protein